MWGGERELVAFRRAGAVEQVPLRRGRASPAAVLVGVAQSSTLVAIESLPGTGRMTTAI